MAARSQPKLLAQGKPRTTGGTSRPWRVRLYVNRPGFDGGSGYLIPTRAFAPCWVA